MARLTPHCWVVCAASQKQKQEAFLMLSTTFTMRRSLALALSLATLSTLPAEARSRHHRSHGHAAWQALAYAPSDDFASSARASRAIDSGLAAAVERQPTLRQSVDKGGLKAMVARHAAQNGVPFALADAVVKVESNYNPRAANRSGAMGLMQIKTQTARGEGFSGSSSDLLNPETNVRYAMKYLATAYRMAGGDLCGTVMRYQQGHGARRMTAADHSYCAKARGFMARG